MRLQDKVILITGASRGVGAACAIAAAREGAHVALAAKTVDQHHTLSGSLNETAEAVRALGRQALVLQVDVRDAEQIRKMVDDTVAHFGRLDALVNNAGAIHWAPVADFPPKKADLVLQVNVRASYLAAHYAIPHLRKNGGHVLMMSPPVVTEAVAGKAPYLISKLGMTLLAMAIDAEEERVAAHALWPVTAIQTAATEVFGLGSPEEWRSPEILADATIALLARDPLTSTFHAWLDEEVLRAEGQTDFTRYRCAPDSEPSAMSILLVHPSWTPPWQEG